MAGVFKAYDIRGVVPDQINETFAYRLGRAMIRHLVAVFGKPAGQLRLGLGYDARPNSEALARAFVAGVTDEGATYLCMGLATTPMTYWLNFSRKLDASVSLTASHNPHPYNGFKLSRQDCIPIGAGTGMEEIEAIFSSITDVYDSAKAPQLVQRSMLPQYINWLADQVTDGDAIHVACDAGNGMAGLDMPLFLDKLDHVQWSGLYMEPDGTFPNHEANPLKEETLRDLQALVRKGGFDLGVAFDGDADRCALVDEKGDLVRADELTALLAHRFLAARPGSAIVYDLRLSRIVQETIEANGGIPVRGRVGHAFMKAAMRESQAPFGGEYSAHYYFGDAHYTDSGALLLIQILNILRTEKMPLSQLLEPFRKYPKTPEINFRVTDPTLALSSIVAEFSEATIDRLDGITAMMAYGFVGVRASNTETLLRLNAEADTPSQLDALVARVLRALGPDARQE